jgi:DNA-binding transcriptional ArsR family regulator
MLNTKRSPVPFAAAAARLKALAHPAWLRSGRAERVRVLRLPATACSSLSQPNASQHLKALRRHDDRREEAGTGFASDRDDRSRRCLLLKGN